MITHGTPSDWIAWVFMLICALVPAACCYRAGTLVGAIDGKRMDVFYGSLMFCFLLAGLLIFFHAPFHVTVINPN